MRSLIRLLIALSATILYVSCLAAEPARTTTTFTDPPATLEQNLGQADDAINFTLRRGETAAALLDDGIIFGVRGSDGTSRATMRWLGAATDIRLEGLERMEKRTDYYIGATPDTWVTEVPSFGRVRYHGVYPGIDLDVYLVGRRLEYDFIVEAGADPSLIRLDFETEDGVELSDNGALSLPGKGGTVLHERPLIYQMVDGERHRVDGQFSLLAATQLGFEIGQYDPNLPLVIDPLVSGILYGDDERGSATAVTPLDDDRVIVVGWSDPVDLLPAVAQTTVPGGRNGYGIIVEGFGSRPVEPMIVREFLIAGNGTDTPVDVIAFTETAGGPATVVIGGTTDSTDFPLAGAPIGGQDCFITKWHEDDGLLATERCGTTRTDAFSGFGHHTWGGIPQTPIADYDNDGDLDLYVTARYSVGSNEFAIIGEYEFDDLTLVRQHDLFFAGVGGGIFPGGLEWYAEDTTWVLAGSAASDLFPNADHPGDPGTQKPFLAQLPIDGPASSPTPSPIDDVYFLDWAGDGPSNYDVTGLALWPINPVGSPASGYVSARRTDSDETGAGLVRSFNFPGGVNGVSGFSAPTTAPKAIFVNREFNVVTAEDILSGINSRGYARRYGGQPSILYGATALGSYSPGNHVVDAAMALNGTDLYVVGESARMTVTAGTTEVTGPSDGWLGHVEWLSLFPDAIVTAGQFQWAPLTPYALHTVFFDWRRIEGLTILGPENGSYPKLADGMQVLVNGQPAAITAVTGTQVNFIAHNDVNLNPTATVQLLYDAPGSEDHFESNIVTMKTADRWGNPFESNGVAVLTHSGGVLSMANPLVRDDAIVAYTAGLGSFGNDSILADELTPGDQAFAVTPPPLVQAVLADDRTFNLDVFYAGTSPGSTAALFQFNAWHPEDFWLACEETGSLTYTLRVTDTATGGEGPFVDPLGNEVMPISEMQAFATCP